MRSAIQDHAEVLDPDASMNSISFLQLAASFPRWILAARTSFSAFLAKTFHIQCCGICPASVVFPLPFMDFGLFLGGGPKLSRRRLLTLARKRLLHVVIAALNFLHDGFRDADLHLLGRRPNAIQKMIHVRLWSLIATCDSPVDVPFSAGRSGPELFARLRELEDFASSHQLLSQDLYGSGAADLDEVRSVGKISGGEKKRAADETNGLAQYRSLDVERLKLTGSGNWPLCDHLHDELWLPFVEPAILRHGYGLCGAAVPNLHLEDKQEYLKLARLWSTKGLLDLFDEPPPENHPCRVFNCLKDERCDRQIGDRRSQNALERSVRGPSRFLPGGYLLTSLHCPPGSVLYGSITDRKDFYHQASVSRSRSHTNQLPFSYEPELFLGDPALDELLRRTSFKKYSRTEVGDRYGKEPKKRPRGRGVALPPRVYPGFASLFQGDRLGVEFALSAHRSLLEDADVLKSESDIRGQFPFPGGPVYESLVIDDYVAISREAIGVEASLSRSSACLKKAKDAYSRSGVLGSPEKDVESSTHFKAIGAEIDCSEKARSRGSSFVSAPVLKRLSLAALSLKAARLPVISRSLASRLGGSWTSVLMFRRPLACLLSTLFSFGVLDGKHEAEVLALPRATADELVLCSVFAFVTATDISVPYLSKIFCTDASLMKGAVCSRPVTEATAVAMWLGGDKKGSYTKLDSNFRAAVKTLDSPLDEDHDDPFDFGVHEGPWISEPACNSCSPSASLDFSFDFVEICGGSGVVSKEAAKLGMTVSAPIELSDSEFFNIKDYRLCEWVSYMLIRGLFRSAMLQPPCTTYSPAAHPSVRSYSQPEGFNLLDPKTHEGNFVAYRCFILMLVAYHFSRPCMLEQPFLSKMAWLKIWKFLRRTVMSEAVVASCQFGSPHLKQFRLFFVLGNGH